jgi:DNA-binding protein HU-beta
LFFYAGAVDGGRKQAKALDTTECGLFNTRCVIFSVAQMPATHDEAGSDKRYKPFVTGMIVNKTDLIAKIALDADISKASAARALDAVIDAVTDTLKKNDSVTLVGFGTFSVSERAERTGLNPRTKEAITIAAAKVPKFKAGKALKDAVN